MFLLTEKSGRAFSFASSIKRGLLFSNFIFLISVISCSSPKLDEAALKQYLLDPENGTMKETALGAYKMQVTYRPNALMVMQELKGIDTVTEAKRKVAEDNYSHFIYFVFAISKNGKEITNDLAADANAFTEQIKQLSFSMGNYVKIITSRNDTIPVADYIYSRMYGAASTSMLFAFNNEKLNQTEYIDFCIGGLNFIATENKFRFYLKDIQHVPPLNITSK